MTQFANSPERKATDHCDGDPLANAHAAVIDDGSQNSPSCS
jgi:hypothetical protein